MSRGGHASIVTSGTTLKGDGSSRRASSWSRVTENTSKGPQKSRTSTLGKTRMPTRLRSIDLSLLPSPCPLPRGERDPKFPLSGGEDRKLEEGGVGLEAE